MDLLDLGKLPVSDASPGGDDARYEPEYDELQQEIDKLSSVTAGGEIDWKRVVQRAYVILSKKSKDIKVASYLAVALMHLKSVEGLSTGTQILLDLITNFWETMFPALSRKRGRFNAVSWWMDSVENFLKNYQGEAVPQAALDLLSQRVQGLDAALSARDGDAPMAARLLDHLGNLPVQAPVVPSPEVLAQAQAEAKAQAHLEATEAAVEAVSQLSPQGGAPAPVGSISSHEEYRRQLKAGLAELAVVADYLLLNDPADRVGYRIRRMVAWLPVSALPPAEGGQTRIPPPDGLEKNAIVQQLESRDFPGALQAAESRVGQYLFWLDLSRLAVEALDAMGGDYRDAKFAVESEIALFVRRLAGIELLTFADGTPFADPKTRSWLKSLGREGGEGLDSLGDKDSASAKVFAQASKLAKDKKVFDAVTVLQNSLTNTSSGRDRFMLRLGMIRLLTEVDQGALAHAHVEEVLEHIREYRLEQWEPGLALSGLRAAYDALTAEGGEEAAALARKTLQRIGRINPAAALKINGLK